MQKIHEKNIVRDPGFSWQSLARRISCQLGRVLGVLYHAFWYVPVLAGAAYLGLVHAPVLAHATTLIPFDIPYTGDSTAHPFGSTNTSAYYRAVGFGPFTPENTVQVQEFHASSIFSKTIPHPAGNVVLYVYEGGTDYPSQGTIVASSTVSAASISDSSYTTQIFVFNKIFTLDSRKSYWMIYDSSAYQSTSNVWYLVKPQSGAFQSAHIFTQAFNGGSSWYQEGTGRFSGAFYSGGGSTDYYDPTQQWSSSTIQVADQDCWSSLPASSTWIDYAGQSAMCIFVVPSASSTQFFNSAMSGIGDVFPFNLVFNTLSVVKSSLAHYSGNYSTLSVPIALGQASSSWRYVQISSSTVGSVIGSDSWSMLREFFSKAIWFFTGIMMIVTVVL